MGRSYDLSCEPSPVASRMVYMSSEGRHRYAGLAGRYLRRHGDNLTEEQAQRKIAGLLAGWKAAMDDRDGIMSRDDGSDLREDELRLPKLPRQERSQWTREEPLEHVTPPQQADHAILTAHNLMQGFDSMVINDARDGMRLHLTAEFVIIRALIEAASIALWILGPDDSDKRLVRALRLRYSELVLSRRLTTKFAGLAPDDFTDELRAQEQYVQGQIDDLVNMARKAGIPGSQVMKAVSPGTVAAEAGAHVAELGPALTYWYWSTASSVSHAEPANTNLLADMQLIGVDHRDQPVAYFEPSAVAIWQHLEVTHTLISSAHALWNRRAASRS